MNDDGFDSQSDTEKIIIIIKYNACEGERD